MEIHDLIKCLTPALVIRSRYSGNASKMPMIKSSHPVYVFFVSWTIFHCHRVIQNGSLLSLLVLYSANKHLFYATGEAKCSKQTKLSETMPRFCLISNHPVKSNRQRAQLPHSVMVSLRVVQSSAGGTFCIYRENEPS